MMIRAFAAWALTIAVWLAAVGTAWAEGRDEKIENPNPDRAWARNAGGFFQAGKSVAVVIAISDYIEQRASGYERLASARTDAEKMVQFLRNDAGFHTIHVLTDEKATRDRINRLMVEEIPRSLGPNDRFLFYWSGHGDQMLNADRKAFGFLPLASSRRSAWSTMISMDDIARWDSYISSRQALFVLDACLSGLAGVEGKNVRDVRLEQLSQSAHQLVTAGTDKEVVISGDKWTGSFFTDSLIIGAKGEAAHNSGLVTLHSLVDFVQHRVAVEKVAARWTKSLTPQMRNLRAGDGTFFFKIPERQVASAAAAGPGGGYSLQSKGPGERVAQRDPGSVEPSPTRRPASFNLSGVWSGRYYYNQKTNLSSVEFTLDLRAVGDACMGRIQEPNTFGDKSASHLFGDVSCASGNVAAGQEFRFRKRYDGTGGVRHSVDYAGVVSQDGNTIAGRWQIPPSGSGAFSMTRGPRP